MDGLSEWTEIGDEQGQDPIGMLAAIENCYQSLLPGFSSVTTRLRYYSFHCWWIHRYMDIPRTKSVKEYQDHTRRCEALLALAAVFDPEKPDSQNGELGLSGSRFANRRVAENTPVINFRKETDRESQPNQRYIQPAGGDFKGIYAPQMVEMGLLGRGKEHDLLATTEAGNRLAKTFDESVGSAGNLFFEHASQGLVTRQTLDTLRIFRPGQLQANSAEAKALRDLLFGREFESEKDRDRRGTLLAILAVAAIETEKGNQVNQEILRWHWMDFEPDPRDPRASIHQRWRHYQSGDTTRVVCEALLAAAVRFLSAYRDGISMPALVTGLVSSISDEMSFGAWMDEINASAIETGLEQIQEGCTRREASIENIMKPLARVRAIWQGRLKELERSYPVRASAQTVSTVLTWVDERADWTARDAVAAFIREMVLQRHLFVAGRKFRGSGASYTFLFEVEEARLKHRSIRGVASSGPRLKTAIQFLEDVGCLDDGFITDHGIAELQNA